MPSVIHRLIVPLCFVLAIVYSPAALAGSFEGLTPGVSTRGEVYQTLGKPLKKNRGGKTCWFDAAPFQGKSIEARFHDSGLLTFLKLEPAKSYSLAQYEGWFGLGKADTIKVKDNTRRHYYEAKGIALEQDGLEPDAPVTAFWHYHDMDAEFSKRLQTLYAQYRAAKKSKDCAAMEQEWRQGRQEFPKISNFIHHQLYWLMTCVGKSGTNREELVALAKKSIEMNPADTDYINLGWLYYSLYNDPVKALAAFSEVDLDENPEIHYFLGECLEKTGKPDKARQHYRAYLKESPKGNWSKQARKNLDAL